VGSNNSSNSNRLKELALREGVESYMIDHEDLLQLSWLVNKKNIGISAGASAPEVSVKNIVNKIESLTKASIAELPGIEESIIFKLPKI
jgi:4-hydroxy-3-methylbut-2-enyl diphosphate reductase